MSSNLKETRLPAIGFLGGTFDPPHAGHLALAHAARSALKLPRVCLVPAGQPWQKKQISAAMHRLRMTELAVGNAPDLCVDRRETKRPNNSYTVDTLRELRGELGESACLVWIIGSDQLARLDSWHQWQKLLRLAHIAVAWRTPKAPLPNPEIQQFYGQHRASKKIALALPHGCIIDIPITVIDVSATALRAQLSRPPNSLSLDEQAQLNKQLSPAVLDYIRTHALYNPLSHH